MCRKDMPRLSEFVFASHQMPVTKMCFVDLCSWSMPELLNGFSHWVLGHDGHGAWAQAQPRLGSQDSAFQCHVSSMCTEDMEAWRLSCYSAAVGGFWLCFVVLLAGRHFAPLILPILFHPSHAFRDHGCCPIFIICTPKKEGQIVETLPFDAEAAQVQPRIRLQKFYARIAAPWDLFIAHSGWTQHYVNLAGFWDGAFHRFKKARRQNIAGPLPTDIDNPKRPHQREKEREREKKKTKKEGQII